MDWTSDSVEPEFISRVFLQTRVNKHVIQMARSDQTRKRNKRGVATVEAALVLPFVVVLVFGYIEIGWYVNSLQILHDATRQGARAAVLLENTNADVQAAVVESLTNSINVDPNAVAVQIWKLNSQGQSEYQVMNLGENENGEAILVTVTIDYSEFRPPSNFMGLAPLDLNSSAVMQRSK